MKTQPVTLLFATVFLLGAPAALAQQEMEREAEREGAGQATGEDEEEGGAVLTRFGGLLTVGGGFGNFIEEDLRDATQTAGTWEARGVLGSRSPLSVEAAYVGSAQSIDALGLSDNAVLVSNGLEGALRLGVPIGQRELLGDRDFGIPLLISPYAFGGLGWKHYSVLNEGANTSNVQDQDDIMTLPLGLGLALGAAGVTLDARVTYRHAFFSDLVGNDTSSFSDAALNQWQLGANLGFEF